MRMKRIVAIAALLVAAAIVGCSWVSPADKAVIHAHRLNADAIGARVATAPALPDWVRTWWAAEVVTWQAMDHWARGEAATPATAPAE